MNWKYITVGFVALWVFLAAGTALGFGVVNPLRTPWDILSLSREFLFYTWVPALILTGAGQVYHVRTRGDARGQ